MELQPNWRKCKKCGRIIKYSDLDAKLGNIPEKVVCPQCKKEKKGKREKIGAVKNESEKEFKGSEIEGTKKSKSGFKWTRPDTVSDVQEKDV